MARLEADNLKKFSTQELIGTGDGSTVAFALSYAPQENDTVLIFVNGLKALLTEYSIVGTTVTFGSAPANTATIEVYYWRNRGES